MSDGYFSRYYQSQTLSGADEVQQFWVDLDSIPEGEASVVTNEMLSASHRRAAVSVYPPLHCFCVCVLDYYSSSHIGV